MREIAQKKGKEHLMEIKKNPRRIEIIGR